MPVAAPNVPYKVLIMRHARRERARHIMCPNQRLKYMFMALLPVLHTAVSLRHSQTLFTEASMVVGQEPSSVTQGLVLASLRVSALPVL